VAVEDRLLAVNDRHGGQRQLEDDCKGRRNEPNSVEKSTPSWTNSLAASSAPRWCPRAQHVTERPPARRAPPSSQRSTQRRTARHGPAYWSLSFLPAERRVPALRRQARRPAETSVEIRYSEVSFFQTSSDAVCVALSFGSLSAFNVRQGKEPFLHHLSPSSRQSLGNEGINSKVDVCELAKHYTNSSGKVV